MKKTFGFLILMFAFLLTSCQTQLKTARTAVTESSLRSVAVADLEVAPERITYTLKPSNDIRRGGFDNVKQAAEQAALTENGNADVLLDPQYVITKKRSLFGTKISSITVSGRPAYYRNFRSLNDTVWTNPAFCGVAPQQKSAGFFEKTTSQKKRASVAKDDGYYRKKGFECYLTTSFLGSMFTADNYCEYCSTSGFGWNLLSSFGYRFNPHFYLGGGIGLAYDGSNYGLFLPLYINARYDFSKQQKTFFVDYKLGGSPVDFLDEGIPSLFNTVAIGYSFGKLDVAFQATYQNYEKWSCPGYSWNYYYNGCMGASGLIHSYGVSFSYRF